MSLPAKNQFNPAFPIADKDGKSAQVFRDYMTALDRLFSTLNVNAANDAAAAAAGVPIGAFYRNGSVVQMRVA